MNHLLGLFIECAMHINIFWSLNIYTRYKPPMLYQNMILNPARAYPLKGVCIYQRGLNSMGHLNLLQSQMGYQPTLDADYPC